MPETVFATAATTTHANKTAMPRFSKELINMVGVQDIVFIIQLSLTAKWSPSAPVNFGFDGQAVIGTRLFPLFGNYLLQ